VADAKWRGKGFAPLSLAIYRSGGAALPKPCAPRALTAGGGVCHQQARSLRCDNQRAAAPRHVCPPHRPLRAWLRSLKRRAYCTRSQLRLWPFNGPSRALKKLDPRRVQLLTSGFQYHSERVGATGALESRRLLINSSRVVSAANPRILQMQPRRGRLTATPR
jgi:hypothetical protein